MQRGHHMDFLHLEISIFGQTALHILVYVRLNESECLRKDFRVESKLDWVTLLACFHLRS